MARTLLVRGLDDQPLSVLAKLLDETDRMGRDVDEPEGARYVMLSDTFVQLFAKRLREIDEGK